jgi:hypothetical protein
MGVGGKSYSGRFMCNVFKEVYGSFSETYNFQKRTKRKYKGEFGFDWLRDEYIFPVLK